MNWHRLQYSKIMRNLILLLLFAYCPLIQPSFSYGNDVVLDQSRSEKYQLQPGISAKYLQNLYFKKCGYSNNLLRKCFLTEKDLNKRGRPNRVLLFRGERGTYSQPATSSYYRWAISKDGFCSSSCNNSDLGNYIYSDLQNLSLGFKSSALFRQEDRTWRNAEGKILYPIDQDRLSPLEIVAITHKQGSGLYFEHDRRQMFDPLISFSLDPQVASAFAKSREKKGVLYVISVPESSIEKISGEECKSEFPVLGKMYDLNECMRDVLNEQEIELNAFMFLPSYFMYGKVSGQ